jgi:hypothetical protein
MGTKVQITAKGNVYLLIHTVDPCPVFSRSKLCMNVPSALGFVAELSRPIATEKSSLQQTFITTFEEMKRCCTYFVMGPSIVVNFRGYFEFFPGEYFVGPLIPVMWAVETAAQERRAVTRVKHMVK